MPQDTETSKRRMATINERGRVIQLHAEGKSFRSIAKDTGISKTQAQRIIKHWSDTGEVEPSPRRGRPQTLNDRDIRHLIRLSDSHPRATLGEITNEAGIKNLKPQTVGKYLHQAN
jgi:transposase